MSCTACSDLFCGHGVPFNSRIGKNGCGLNRVQFVVHDAVLFGVNPPPSLKSESETIRMEN